MGKSINKGINSQNRANLELKTDTKIDTPITISANNE